MARPTKSKSSRGASKGSDTTKSKATAKAKKKPARSRSHSTKVELKNGLIRITLTGYISADVVHRLHREVQRLVTGRKTIGKKALILLDLHGVTGHSSSARLAGKDFVVKIDYDRLGIYGANRDLSRVVMYILRTANVLRRRARYFRRERDALSWVRATKRSNYSLLITRGTAIITAIVATAGLYGWVANVDVLRRLYPSFNASNPLSLLCFLLVAVVVYVQSTTLSDRRKRQIILPILAIVFMFVISVLLRYILGLDKGLDTIFLGPKLAGEGGDIVYMSPRVATSLLLLVTTLFLARTRSRRLHEVSQVMLLLLFLLVGTALVGFAFGIERLYNYTNTPSVTTLSGVLMTLLLSIGIFALYEEWTLTRRIRELNRALALGILVFCLAELLTGVAWRQANNKVRQDAQYNYSQEFQHVSGTIDDRLSGYTQVLNGYQAFFQSSTFVSRQDFRNFFATLKTDTAFPGFSTLTYVQHVSDADKQSFLDSIRAEQTNNGESHADFTITPEGDRADYYPITYVEPAQSPNTSNYGFDTGTESDRFSALTLARDTGQPVSTGPLKSLGQLAAATPERRGFLMVMPVYNSMTPGTVDERRQQLRGFVYAGFIYNNLFNGLLKSELNNGVRATIEDTGAKMQIYREGLSPNSSQRYITRSSIVFAAGRPWRLTVNIPVNYGVSDAERSLPLLLISGGTIVSVMLAFLVGNLAFGRDRASALAESITADLRNERNAAIANQRKDEAILSSIGDAVFAIDNEGLITLFNPAAGVIANCTEAEVLGNHYVDTLKFIDENENDTVRASRNGYRFITKALAGKLATREIHTTLVREDGMRVPVAASAAPIRDSRGYMYGVIVVMRDMTSERELEKAKDEFVSLTSHQLRTPLTAIRLFSEMLSSEHAGTLSRRQSDYAEKINISTERMIRLVGEILNVSRIELGELIINPQPTDLEGLVQSCIDEVAPLARERGAKISLVAPKRLAHLPIDPNLFEQVVHNLLTNAIRYTKPSGGKVVVEVKKTTRTYTVSVTDNGIGIPQRAQNSIFERFYRADNAIETEADGTGLGLYLVKMVLQAAGCSVSFKSTEGKGTVFYVTIPLKGMKARAGSKELSRVV